MNIYRKKKVRADWNVRGVEGKRGWGTEGMRDLKVGIFAAAASRQNDKQILTRLPACYLLSRRCKPSNGHTLIYIWNIAKGNFQPASSPAPFYFSKKHSFRKFSFFPSYWTRVCTFCPASLQKARIQKNFFLC